jgi:hypothetical protein
MECFVNNHALKIYDLFDYDGITAPRKHPITRPAYILHEDYFYQFYYGKWKQLDPIAPHRVANWPRRPPRFPRNFPSRQCPEEPPRVPRPHSLGAAGGIPLLI